MGTEGPLGQPLVFIVDDEEAVRSAVQELFLSAGRLSRTYSSALEFLEQADPLQPGCLLSDVRLPGLGGLALQARLADHGFTLPVILMSGHADVQMAVRGLKAGARDFLLKPLRDQDVLDATEAAIEADLRQRADALEVGLARSRLAALSERERQVLAFFLDGKKNREAAAALDLSQITVKIYRASGMKKLKARSIQDLVRTDRLLDFAISSGGRPL